MVSAAVRLLMSLVAKMQQTRGYFSVGHLYAAMCNQKYFLSILALNFKDIIAFRMGLVVFVVALDIKESYSSLNSEVPCVLLCTVFFARCTGC